MAGKEIHTDTPKEGKAVVFADNRTLVGLVVILLLAVFGVRGMVRDLMRDYGAGPLVSDSVTVDMFDSLRLGLFPEGTVVVTDSAGVRLVFPDSLTVCAGEGVRE